MSANNIIYIFGYIIGVLVFLLGLVELMTEQIMDKVNFASSPSPSPSPSPSQDHPENSLVVSSVVKMVIGALILGGTFYIHRQDKSKSSPSS